MQHTRPASKQLTRILHEYRCEKIKVCSTGNAVVDRVRLTLSYNNIVISQNREKLGRAHASSTSRFNQRVYNIIVGETMDIYHPTCPIATDKCASSSFPFFCHACTCAAESANCLSFLADASTPRATTRRTPAPAGLTPPSTRQTDAMGRKAIA